MLDIIWASTKTCGCFLRDIYIYIDVWHYPVLWEHVIWCISIIYTSMNISTLVAKQDLVNFHIMSSVITVPKAQRLQLLDSICFFSVLRPIQKLLVEVSIRTSASFFSNSAMTRMLKYLVIFWGISLAIVTLCALLGLVFYNHPCKRTSARLGQFYVFSGRKRRAQWKLNDFWDLSIVIWDYQTMNEARFFNHR